MACAQDFADPKVVPISKPAPVSSSALQIVVAPMRYSFTADKVKPPVVKVEPSEVFDSTLGYGFTSVPDGNEQAFAIRLSPGDYRVTATLGLPKAPSRTTFWAEDRRLMTPPIVLKKGEKRTISFTVNVRNPGLEPSPQDATKAPKVALRGDEPIGRTWDDMLTIAVSGEAPALRSLDIVPVKVKRVLIAGGSSVSDEAGADYAGWGQMLPRFLGGTIAVANHARAGETIKSFITSLRWDKLLSEVRSGDIVLIQFAHDDDEKQWARTYLAPATTYPAYLAALVADVRQRGGMPVLVTPVAQRVFKDGKIENTHAGYDQAVRDLASGLKVPLIDLTEKTTRLYETLGPELSALAFANQGKDNTQFNTYGAMTVACYVASDLSRIGELGIKVAEATPPCDLSKPGDPRAFELTASDWPVMRFAGAPSSAR